MKPLRIGGVVVLVASLGGCAGYDGASDPGTSADQHRAPRLQTSPPVSIQAPVRAPASTTKPVQAPVRSSYQSPQSLGAVNQLLQQADGDLVRGETGIAQSKAERALRLQPDNAEVYYLLARISYKQGQWREAWNWGKKGLQQKGDEGLRHQLRDLVTQAERAMQ